MPDVRRFHVRFLQTAPHQRRGSGSLTSRVSRRAKASRWGFRGLRANAAKAELLLKKKGGTPSLIVLDLGLDRGRFEFRERLFCESLRMRFPKSPIVGITSLTLTDVEAFDLKNLIDDFIPKRMLRPPGLRSVVSRLLQASFTKTTLPRLRSERPRIIVTYAHEDSRHMRRVVTDLESRGFAPWSDKLIRPGNDIVIGVSKALARADVVLAILSKRSKTKWVRQEVVAALMRKLGGGRTAVIPIRIDNVRLPPLLQSTAAVDLFKDYSAGLEKLIDAPQAYR